MSPFAAPPFARGAHTAAAAADADDDDDANAATSSAEQIYFD